MSELTDARKWLSENPNPAGFASNHFESPKHALAFVEELYRLGAQDVLIEQRFVEEDGPYADSLEILMPDDTAAALVILYRCRDEKPDDEQESKDERGTWLWVWWD